MQGSSGLPFGEFGDVVSDPAAMNGIQPSEHVIRTELQQDLRRRRGMAGRSRIVGSKERLHQTLAAASVSVLRRRRPIDLVALYQRPEQRARFRTAILQKERGAIRQ